MAISKLILNGEVQMDVTSNTNAANNMLNGVVGTKNDGTSVTGNIASKSSDDLTVSDATVTAPAGYYANAASKAVSTTTHPNPTASITSSTGVVTASHTQGTGYVTDGTTTGTLNLTTQAGKTVTPTESAQTAVASYRWTTGNVTVAAISSTYVGTGVTRYNASGLTFNGSEAVVAAGYYSSNVGKYMSKGTAMGWFSFTSSTGAYSYGHEVIVAGYVSTGSVQRGQGTFATQAAQTIYPSTRDQTIDSYRWLTGDQTIKSVTTSNLTAENIAEGVTVQVGDANNASRITQITGTHSGAPSYTATISGTGNSSYCYVTYAGTKRYTNGTTFTYKAGDTLTIYCRGNNVKINGDSITLSSYSYTYTLPVGDITIALTYSSSTSNNIVIQGLIKPTGTLTVSAVGTNDVYKYALISVPEGQVGYPTATKGTVSNHSISVTPRVNISDSGYVDAGVLQGTAVSVSASELVSGTKSITENSTDIDVTNYASVDVNVSGGGYTATITGTGDINSTFVQVNGTGTRYYTNGDTITYQEGDYLYIYCTSSRGGGTIIVDEVTEKENLYNPVSLNYTPPKTDIIINLSYNANGSVVTVTTPTKSITTNGIHAVDGYANVDVNVGEGFTADQIAMRTISGDISGNATSIGSYAFYYCSGLTTVSFPAAQIIYGSAFYGCRSLTTANFPSCSSIGTYAFYSCYSLTTVSFPSCNSISASAFYGCSSLTTANFPSCSLIGTGAFRYCSSLTTASFPAAQIIYGSAFASCYNLVSLYLLGSFVVSLSNSNAFVSTPISNYTTSTGGVYGSIFVPASLYSEYITTTNWSVYSVRIVSV